MNTTTWNRVYLQDGYTQKQRNWRTPIVTRLETLFGNDHSSGKLLISLLMYRLHSYMIINQCCRSYQIILLIQHTITWLLMNYEYIVSTGEAMSSHKCRCIFSIFQNHRAEFLLITLLYCHLYNTSVVLFQNDFCMSYIISSSHIDQSLENMARFLPRFSFWVHYFHNQGNWDQDSKFQIIDFNQLCSACNLFSLAINIYHSPSGLW